MRRLSARNGQELAIAGVTHPARPRHMRVPASLRAVPVDRRVAAKHDPRHLAPVGADLLRIKKAEIGDMMEMVVRCQQRAVWRLIGWSSAVIGLGRHDPALSFRSADHILKWDNPDTGLLGRFLSFNRNRTLCRNRCALRDSTVSWNC